MASQPMNPYLEVLPEVAEALQAGRPVVALESTIIAHGMPWPQNAETARRVSATVRASGAVPATIAVIDGRLKAGLSGDEIDLLARQGTAVMKCSRRDLPFVISRKVPGATTVAATMIIAEMAGIRVFATGGIGGVHRGAAESFDISADLTELGQTPVAVVCAGVKSILDLALTREYLETLGVPVLGYRTDRLPAFYCRESDQDVDFNMQSTREIAEFLHCKWAMGLDGGVVIANPIPEEFAMPAERIDREIERALRAASDAGIHGKESTPFLLRTIAEVTGGDSLQANIELVLNNARLASAVAGELVSMRA